jgi:hypothetical protein
MDAPDVDALRRAWQAAADDLGIRVVLEAFLEDADGHRHELVAVVPSFGGRSGMAILREPDATVVRLAETRGFGWTNLGHGYERYDRALFQDTLNDWHWSGPGNAPDWYAGAP